MVMRYGSVCSGIEAASVAFAPLGWQEAGVPLAVILPLRGPLLAWCKEYRPRLTAMVSEQLMVLDHRQDALEQAWEVVLDGNID